MRFLNIVTLAGLATGVVGAGWLGSTVYNKWHETELERWLSDHDIPYPTPADRKDLEKLIEKNWEAYAVYPYNSWDSEKLGSYLKQKGVDVKDDTKANHDALVQQVQQVWYETADKTNAAYGDCKSWMFDTWTDSSLKAFADKHGIPVPQPRKRDTLLQKIRSSYEASAKKAGETISYPSNWLYETWTESDFKEWLDTNGFPAPQPSSRDKLIASVRRNSHLAYLKMQEQSDAATASANAAIASLSDKVINAWGESQLKEFCDKNGIKVPQGSKENELRALVRKHRAQLLSDTVSQSGQSAFGAATSAAGNEYAKATDSATLMAEEAFNKAINLWSDSRLKAYLDARGVPVPQGSKTDELRALVRRNAHKATDDSTQWKLGFGDMSLQDLKKYLADNGNSAAKKVSEKTGSTREELAEAAQSAYSSASSAGGDNYASMTSYLSQATDSAQQSTFDTWTESDLKAYLDSYGVPVPQGSKLEELKAEARKQSNYFKYGTTGPVDTASAKIMGAFKEGYQWVMDKVAGNAETVKTKAEENKDEL